MQAIVLVGGEGTRLRPLTLTTPKPALPLVDRPFLRFAVDWLARHGASEVVMACASDAAPLREELSRAQGGPAIRFVEEPEPLGTAGPLRLAADLGILAERFLAVNGDLLTDLDLSALLRAHAERGAVATIALHTVADPSPYGLVRCAPDGAVTAFVEKPEPGAAGPGEVNAGAYVLERAVVELIPSGRPVSIEREVFPRLAGQGLYGLRLEGYWMDIGTPDRYLQASWDVLEGRVETNVPTDGSGVFVAAGATVDEGATIGPRAVVGPACAVAGGAAVSGSVLLSGCFVGPAAEVRDSIVGRGAEVGPGARVRGAVIGDGARLGAGARLEPGARVGPGDEVPGGRG